jgi:hypothetical protein
MTGSADLKADEVRIATTLLDAVSRGSAYGLSSASLQGLIAVFTDSTGDRIWIGVYRVGDHGASLVASRTLPSDGRAVYRDVLRGLGLRIGKKYLGHEFVWVIDDLGCCVWSSSDIRMRGTALELSLPTGIVHTSDVRAVVSFVDDDLIHRGVRLELVNGKQPLLVDEFDEIAEMDPTYGRDNLELSEAHWVSVLGRDFAAWLHVPHRNDAFPHDP